MSASIFVSKTYNEFLKFCNLLICMDVFDFFLTYSYRIPVTFCIFAVDYPFGRLSTVLTTYRTQFHKLSHALIHVFPLSSLLPLWLLHLWFATRLAFVLVQCLCELTMSKAHLPLELRARTQTPTSASCQCLRNKLCWNYIIL